MSSICVKKEIMAAEDNDSAEGLKKFDRTFWSHFGFIVSNHFRSLFLGLTNAYFVYQAKKNQCDVIINWRRDSQPC